MDGKAGEAATPIPKPASILKRVSWADQQPAAIPKAVAAEQKANLSHVHAQPPQTAAAAAAAAIPAPPAMKAPSASLPMAAAPKASTLNPPAANGNHELLAAAEAVEVNPDGAATSLNLYI